MTDRTRGQLTLCWLIVCGQCGRNLVIHHPQRGFLRRHHAEHEFEQRGWQKQRGQWSCPDCKANTGLPGGE